MGRLVDRTLRWPSFVSLLQDSDSVPGKPTVIQSEEVIAEDTPISGPGASSTGHAETDTEEERPHVERIAPIGTIEDHRVGNDHVTAGEGGAGHSLEGHSDSSGLEDEVEPVGSETPAPEAQPILNRRRELPPKDTMHGGVDEGDKTISLAEAVALDSSDHASADRIQTLASPSDAGVVLSFVRQPSSTNRRVSESDNVESFLSDLPDDAAISFSIPLPNVAGKELYE